jgi:hypothetical protein
MLLGHDDHAVVVRDHHIARMDQSSGANDRSVDRADRGLHRAFGMNRPRPHGKTHLAQLPGIAAAGVDHQGQRAARAKRRGE